MSGRTVGTGLQGRFPGGSFLALTLILSVLSAPLAAGEGPPVAVSDPHSHFRNPGACRGCHAYRHSALEPDRFIPEADSVCLGCHSLEGLGATHPRNVRPAGGPGDVPVPKDLRLDSEGRMMCLTCHAAHGPFLSPTPAFAGQEASKPEASAGGKPAYRTYFARRSDPVRGFAPLCEACHGAR